VGGYTPGHAIAAAVLCGSQGAFGSAEQIGTIAMVIRHSDRNANRYAVAAAGILGAHGVDDLFPNMARPGRRRVGQHGDIFVMGPAQQNIVGARAVDAEGAFQDPNTDLGFRFVERDYKQGEWAALGGTVDPGRLQSFVQLLAGFE